MNGQLQDGLARTLGQRMLEAGLEGATPVSVEPESGAFGDAMATFMLGHLLLRVVRDRGEEFLDIGLVEEPGNFFQYDDVEVAMGWRSLEEVLSKRAPESLENVLERLAGRLAELQAAFAPKCVESTRERIRAAEKERGEAFVARLMQR